MFIINRTINNVKSFASSIKQYLLNDNTNYYAVIISFVLFLLCYIVWKLLLGNNLFIFYSPYSFYPLYSFVILFLINIIISFRLYQINKEYSRVLMVNNILLLIIIFVLEIYYWVNL